MHNGDVSALRSKSDLRDIFEAEVRRQEDSWRRRVDRLSHSLLAWRLALLRSLGPRHAFA